MPRDYHRFLRLIGFVLFVDLFDERLLFVLSFLLKDEVLPLIERLLFELRPNKVGLFHIFGDLKPESAFHDCFDEIAVVAPSDIYLEGVGVFGDIKLSVNSIGEVDHEDEFFEFVDFDIDAVVVETLEGFEFLGWQGLELVAFVCDVSWSGRLLLLFNLLFFGEVYGFIGLGSALTGPFDEFADTLSLHLNARRVEITFDDIDSLQIEIAFKFVSRKLGSRCSLPH